jgi:hypothetical protein
MRFAAQHMNAGAGQPRRPRTKFVAEHKSAGAHHGKQDAEWSQQHCTRVQALKLHVKTQNRVSAQRKSAALKLQGKTQSGVSAPHKSAGAQVEEEAQRVVGSPAHERQGWLSICNVS